MTDSDRYKRWKYREDKRNALTLPKTGDIFTNGEHRIEILEWDMVSRHITYSMQREDQSMGAIVGTIPLSRWRKALRETDTVRLIHKEVQVFSDPVESV